MKEIINNIRDVIWLYRPYVKYGKAYVLISLFFWVVVLPLSRILTVIFPQHIVDALGSGKTLSETTIIIVLYQLVFLVIPLFENAYNVFFRDKAEAKIELCIKKDLYLQSLQTDYKYIDNPKYYDKYTWAIEHQAEKAKESHYLINNVLSALAIVTAMIGIISTFNPLIVILTVLSMVIRTYGYMKYNKKEVDRQNALLPWDRRLDYFHRIFYIKEYSADLRSTTLKDSILTQYGDVSEKKLGTITKYAHKLFRWATFSDVVYRIAMTLIIFFIAKSIVNGDIAGASSYVTLMLAVDRLEEYMYELFELVKSGNKLSLYAQNIREFYSMESIIEQCQTKSEQKEPESGAFSIDFYDVNFKYPNSDFSITDFRLHVSQGEKIAIVGENGVGKSTFLKLILRFYDPISGQININNIPLEQYDITKLRRKIGVVFQSTNIYAMSLLNNMSLYNNISEQEAISVLKATSLEKLLTKNNASVDTEMTKEFSEEGIITSGGEAQKIGISRIMSGHFGLLLLDEPSSALDPIAEYELNHLIMDRSRKTTTIVVAHRLSTIRDMDRIVLLDGGRIGESGTHDELMNRQGKYHEMFTKQAENYLK